MEFKEFLQQLLYLVATGILPVLTVYIVTFLKSKINEQVANLDSEKYKQLKEYIIDATDIIGQVVIEVNQTFVDKLKLSGAFTEEAMIEAKNMAVNKCKLLISEKSKEAINVLHNDFETYLNSKIEEMVNKNKVTYIETI